MNDVEEIPEDSMVLVSKADLEAVLYIAVWRTFNSEERTLLDRVVNLLTEHEGE